jgi:DNA-directed RNA polymerase subunit beta
VSSRKIVPEEDMPFLPDGTSVEIVLNPLGVPSRMNVGQVLETHLGWAVQDARHQGGHARLRRYRPRRRSTSCLKQAGLPKHGKSPLFDGRTGEPFDQEVVVGYIYMLKLYHLVDDKIHARAIGPYSLVTQQPLGGKAQYGGQRFGEMEVWALEAYGAALHRFRSCSPSSPTTCRAAPRSTSRIVKGDNTLDAGTPESFNVLIKRNRSPSCLDVKLGQARRARA